MNSNVYMSNDLEINTIKTSTYNNPKKYDVVSYITGGTFSFDPSDLFDNNTTSQFGFNNNYEITIPNINKFINKIILRNTDGGGGSSADRLFINGIEYSIDPTASSDDIELYLNKNINSLNITYSNGAGSGGLGVGEFELYYYDNINILSDFIILSGNCDITGDLKISGTTYNYGGGIGPFTGLHTFKTLNTGLTIGDCVYLSSGITHIDKTYRSGQTDVVGIVLKIENDNVDVAAVGDNEANLLNGFKVCNENGSINKGTLLITSSKPGYLMAQSDIYITSMTVGKAMEDVIFDVDGKATDVYGFLYSG